VDRPLRAVRDRFWRRPARWAGALALALAAGAAAQPLVLLTEEEVAAEPLGNPIRIDLVFAAAPDAEIDPASFRVQYGALRLDLTERILARVVVDKTGLKVDNVVIPRGNHRLLLHIADTKARVGETELRFTVQ
jgi:hypothetical protein